MPRVGDKKLSPSRDGLRILGRVIVLLLIYRPWVSVILPGHLLMFANEERRGPFSHGACNYPGSGR